MFNEKRLTTTVSLFRVSNLRLSEASFWQCYFPYTETMLACTASSAASDE